MNVKTEWCGRFDYIKCSMELEYDRAQELASVWYNLFDAERGRIRPNVMRMFRAFAETRMVPFSTPLRFGVSVQFSRSYSIGRRGLLTCIASMSVTVRLLLVRV